MLRMPGLAWPLLASAKIPLGIAQEVVDGGSNTFSLSQRSICAPVR